MAPSKKWPAERRDSRTPSVKNLRRPLTSSANAANVVPAQQALFLTPPSLAGTSSPPEVKEKHRFPVGYARTRQLWLCIHLPSLPLEALNSGKAGTEAVFENQQGHRRVLMSNARTEMLGVTRGIPVNAALALLPSLALAERDPQKERRVLEQLAAWAGRFTSMVSIELPDLLLLEIGGSLQLFGDIETLRQQIESGLEEKGFNPSVAIAPAALASIWLARAGCRVSIEETGHLSGALGPLPLNCLQWPDPVRESLNGMGVYCIGDCLRLPREGFTKRFGAARLLQLDRALGYLPDPRKGYRAPERFCEEYELGEEQDDSALLLQACRELLANLEQFLMTRQVMVQRLQFSFFHLRAAATHLTLGCRQEGRRAEQWFELLAIRFERLTLAEPVIAIRLQSGTGQPLQASTETLEFNQPGKRRQNESITGLLERLRARMGSDSIYGVTAVAEHRPQYAWSPAGTAESRPPQCAAVQNDWYTHASPLLLAEMRRTNNLLLRRPLWMLPDPLALANRQGRPQYHGPLKLLDGPERIETGWWDSNGINRDYFVAVNRHGAHLWIYRNRKRTDDHEAEWYLHGIFG